VSWKASAWAKEQTTGSPAKKALLLCLADYADEDNSCFPGQDRLATETEQSVRTVRRQLEDLEMRGLIVRERRVDKHGHRTSDRYVLQIPTGQSGRKDPEPESLPDKKTLSLPDTAMAGELPVEPPVTTGGDARASENADEDDAGSIDAIDAYHAALSMARLIDWEPPLEDLATLEQRLLRVPYVDRAILTNEAYWPPPRERVRYPLRFLLARIDDADAVREAS